jgi:Domain of unknown function (DUF4760)
VSRASEWAGNILGVQGGIQNISSSYAALLGLLVVILGWIINARIQRYAYRVENARNTVFYEDEKLRDHVSKLAPYWKLQIQFPDYVTLRKPEHTEFRQSLMTVLNALELLALDISTGRASEDYVAKAQRALICQIFITAQDYISTLRKTLKQKEAYKSLEVLFIRLYINRHPYMQNLIELIIGNPWFRYSYLVFRFRWLLIANNVGLDPNYRNHRWPDILHRMRQLRHINIALSYIVIFIAIVWFIRWY